MRHGESQWNLENRFTGWVDVDLTEKGRKEAALAGQLLKKQGFVFDLCYTSVLKRAIRTLCIAFRRARPTLSSCYQRLEIERKTLRCSSRT